MYSCCVAQPLLAVRRTVPRQHESPHPPRRSASATTSPRHATLLIFHLKANLLSETQPWGGGRMEASNVFRSVAAVRNIDSALINVTPTIKFLKDGSVRTIALAPIALGAGESRIVDLTTQQKSGLLPADLHQASLELVPDNNHGNIVAELFNFSASPVGTWSAPRLPLIRIMAPLPAGAPMAAFKPAGGLPKINVKELQEDTVGILSVSFSSEVCVRNYNVFCPTSPHICGPDVVTVQAPWPQTYLLPAGSRSELGCSRFVFRRRMASSRAQPFPAIRNQTVGENRWAEEKPSC